MKKTITVYGTEFEKEVLVEVAKRCRKEWYEEFDAEEREMCGSLGDMIKGEIYDMAHGYC